MPNYRRANAAGATYFFTVALADRSSHLLVDEIDRLRRAFHVVRKRAPFEIVAICVLPDHLHTVWTLPENDADFSARWAQIKRLFSSGLPPSQSRSESKANKREKGIWQRRFWEHQIRNEAELQRCVDYIHFNPVKHGHVSHVCDWPHSSFLRYVQHGWLNANWGEGQAAGLGAMEEMGE